MFKDYLPICGKYQKSHELAHMDLVREEFIARVGVNFLFDVSGK